MRIAYLDCFSGISGDMFLGALVDAGVSARLLEETVAALNVDARIEFSRVMRGGITATKVDVFANGEKDLPREEFWRQTGANHLNADAHGHAHSHEHHHSHDDADSHEHSDTRDHGHAHEHGRGLVEIRPIIAAANISESAKKTAIAIFEALGAAEAEIHNTSIEQVHFHEVGAVDAMVDIICAAVGAEALGVDEWVCSPLNVGGGTVEVRAWNFARACSGYGEIVGGAPVYSSGPQVELVTPTGAAIVKTLARRFAAFPAMKIEKAGYGAGSREFARHPNLLRLTVGEALPAAAMAGSASDGRSRRRMESRLTALLCLRRIWMI